MPVSRVNITNPTLTTTRPVIDNALPGVACQFTVRVINNGPGTARLEGFLLESPDFVSGGIRATVAECGQDFLPGTPENAVFTIWVDDIAPEAQLVFDPNLDGLLFATNGTFDGTGCEQT